MIQIKQEYETLMKRTLEKHVEVGLIIKICLLFMENYYSFRVTQVVIIDKFFLNY